MILDTNDIWVTDSKNIQRFWLHVTKSDGCWEYSGAKGKWGHAWFGAKLNGRHRTVHAHRFSWFLANGRIPIGKVICHNCPGGDNPACVRPSHLFPGTHADNVHDCERKGRGIHPKGEGHALSKLSEEAVRELLTARFIYKQSVREIMRRCGMSQSALSHIFNGRNWSHVSKEFGVLKQPQIQYRKNRERQGLGNVVIPSTT